jgi:cytochrome P450
MSRVEDASLEFNPFLPEMRADPYPIYHQLRSTDPVHQSFPGVWILTRYADCSTVIRDPVRFSSDSRNSNLYRAFQTAWGRDHTMMEDATRRTMLFIDPPDHTRLRNLVSKAFTARRIEALRPHIQDIVRKLLDDIEGSGRDTFDLINDVAYPLPVTVICEMLGVPSRDWDQFHRWSQALVVTLDPIMSDEVLGPANEAALAFGDYFAGLLADRRAHPKDDLLTAMITAEDRGERLTEQELLAMCVLLLIAGHETTVNLIGNGMLALLRHPDQLERLQNRPSMIRSAVEEFLRFDSPVQFIGRTLMEDAEIGGRRLGKGEMVIAVVGAANRDPAQFADPDRLDIGRADNRHLSFGGGIHFCLGAPLARVEGQIAIAELVTRFPRLDLATEDFERRQTVTLRGLSSLPVAVR